MAYFSFNNIGKEYCCLWSRSKCYRTGLINVLGFDSMLESARKDSIKMLDAQRDSIIAQFHTSFPKLPQKITKEIEEAFADYASRVNASWKPAEAARIYTSAIIDALPENEVRAAIEHYRTPEGQRELKVISEAAKRSNTYIMQSIQSESEKAFKDLSTKIRAIIEKMKNQKER